MKGPLKFLEEYFVSFEKPFSENWRGRIRWRPLIRMGVFGYNIMEQVSRKTGNPLFLEKLFRYFRKGMHIIVM